jgi:hypothetical protein
MARVRRKSRSRCPTATSIVGLVAGLPIRLPPLTSNRFLHVHENLLRSHRPCDHNFTMVKIGLDGETRN